MWNIGQVPTDFHMVTRARLTHVFFLSVVLFLRFGSTHRVEFSQYSAAAAGHAKALMQGQSKLARSRLGIGLSAEQPAAGEAPGLVDSSSCTHLRNRGTHFTVEIEVGTPGQKFDVVADTGSNSVIVPSCLCQQKGPPEETGEGCSKQDRCFTGTGKSSSFGALDASNISAVILTFGSGQIEAIIASDIVRVGQSSAEMKEGLLLMVDRRLDLVGPFEGILGLGLPSAFIAEQAKQKSSGGAQGHMILKGDMDMPGNISIPKGFMEVSGTQSFSVCFNDGADGLLRLNHSPMPVSLGSVGQVHWGLDFGGVSVESKNGSSSNVFSKSAGVCQASTMKSGQVTPCGAIPDSGTTVIMAPKEHLRKLFETMCNSWPMCKRAVKDSDQAPHQVFQLLLFDCDSWMSKDDPSQGGTNGTGLGELPTLQLHVRGADGKSHTLSLEPVDYVMETEEDQMHLVLKHLFGVLPVTLPISSGLKKKVCAPAFAVMEYNTKLNGPVWILGMPLFYKYQVGYNLTSSPPSVSFSDEPCGVCSNEASLVSNHGRLPSSAQGSRDQTSRSSKRKPRQIHGPLRIPHFDMSRGL